MADPYRYFRIEAGEILEQLQQGLLDLEKDGALSEVLPRMLRLAHTLKGAARVVRQKEIADLSHAIEDALVPFRDRAEPVSREAADRTLRITDAIRKLVANLATAPVVVPPNAARVGSEEVVASRSADEPLRALRTDVRDVDAVMDGIAETGVLLGSIKKTSGQLERVRGLSELLADQLAPWRAQDPRGRERARSLAQELFALTVGVEREIGGGLEQASRELGQARDSAEKLRLLPSELMFGTLERTARDAARSLGKSIRFEASGGEVRIDVDLLSAMQSALVQAVRNAVAHGIEQGTDRQAKGKPNDGAITIQITRRGKFVDFACRDDGRGLDLDAVRAVAQRRGLLPADHARLEADELIALLLKGGISTSQAVTEVSGRGVGLDLVREVAERFQGCVSLRAQPGSGTALTVSVPISVSAMTVLVVETAGRRVALPLDAVRRTFRLPQDEVARTANGETVTVEGLSVPFVPLIRILDRRARDTAGAKVWSVVLIEADETVVALGVERLLGTESVVVRVLPAEVEAEATAAGVSLDAEGNPRLLLEPTGVVAAAVRITSAPFKEGSKPLPVLVIDDSLTTRMLEQSILESAGYEVHTATSGEEGLIKAHQQRYALFLVDVEMPGIDGFTFIERARADPELHDIPAILVTSRNSPEDLARGKSVGARAHIVKSEFDQTDLLARIRRLVG
jgi:two-component system chemotaxis sensor kinase CheA